MNKKEREFKTVLIKADEPPNLHTFCELIAQKIKKGMIRL